MKRAKRIVATINILVVLLVVNLLNVSAASNPYPTSQTISGVTTIPCTWYAWQQAYDNTGVAMPNFGNAKNWYTSAKNNGYSVGSEPKAKSIAVWTNSGYGHVGYVVSVSGSTMKVNEGGMYNTNGTAANGNGIINGSTCNSTVGSNKSSYSSSVLVGFIYLTDEATANVTVGTYTSKNTVSDTNAILYGKVTKNSSASVTQIGIKVWKDGDSESNAWSKFDAPSQSYVGSTTMIPYYNMNTELNVTLTHATKYNYKIYAKVGGKEYWSSAASFTTTGSHSYGEWKTITAAKCESTGTKTRYCSCGASESATISALGHSYSSTWTIDKEATCTTEGSKSYHCTRCDSKKSVTKISATGHKYGDWITSKAATCTTNGTKVKKCSCGVTISDTISAIGHSWSSWKVEKEATTESEGKNTRSCTACKTVETTILPKLPEENHTHEFDEWQIETPSTCTESGVSSCKCKTCGTTQTKTVSAEGHNFGEWNCIKESTTSELGVYERYCNNCQYKEIKQTDILIDETEEIDSTMIENFEEDKIEKSNDEKTKEESTYIVPITIAIIAVLGASVAFVLILKKRKQ